MRRIRILIVLGVLVWSGAEARAQAAGAFARLGFGARGIAMGNALAADGFGDGGPYYNPALAPFTSRQNLELSAALMRFDRELQFVQFSAPLRPRAGIALGLIHAGVSKIDGRDGSGFHTGDLSVDEFALFLAFGLRLSDRVTGGIGLQLFRTDLLDGLDPVNSVGIDLGLTVRVTEALRLGFVADDLLARYSFDTSGLFGDSGKTTSDRFPTRLRFGAAYRLLDGRLTLLGEYESRLTRRDRRTRSVELFGDVPREVVDTETLTLQENRVRFGGEYRLAETFVVRGGLDQLGSGEVDGLKPTAGFMVEQPVGNLRVRAEYAFALEPFAVGTMHLLSLRIFL
ncbi:PorV/PorQ family protein [Rhodocaloribacter sp.]